MTDKRVVRETRLRTFVRQNLRSPITWAFSVFITQLITGKVEYTLTINIPIIIFAVVTGYIYERFFLRIRWGIER